MSIWTAKPNSTNDPLSYNRSTYSAEHSLDNPLFYDRSLMQQRENAPLDQFLTNISNIESTGSGGYKAVGIKTKYGKGLGKYQVMEAFLPEWSKEHLGRVVSAKEFLGSPALQEQIVRARISQLYKRYGNWGDVASVWHSGRPLAKAAAAGAQDGLGTKTTDYARRAIGGMKTVLTGYGSAEAAQLPGPSTGAPSQGVRSGSSSSGSIPQWLKKSVNTQQPFTQNKFQDNATVAKTFAKNIVQGSLRGSAAAGAAIAGIPRQVKNTIFGGDTSVGKMRIEPEDTFLGQLQRSLYGTDKPISFQSEGEAVPYVKEGSPVAPVIGAALSAMDLFGAGSGTTLKTLVKALKATEDAAEASRLLKAAGFADDIAKDYGATFAKTTDETAIATGLKKAEELQNSTKVTSSAAKGTDTVERSFITSTKETVPELSTRVAGQYVPRSTDLLSMKASNLIKDNIDAAESLARTGSSDKAVATAAELIKKYTADARAAADEASANVFFDKAADIANVVARTLTEQGRAVQAASILGRLTPEGVVRFAAREIQRYNESIDVAKNRLGGLNPTAMKSKIPELTGEQTADFTKQAKVIENMPDGVEKAMAWHKLNEQIAALVPSTLYKKVIAVWKAGLLTGIKTSGLNIASNLSHGVSEVIKDVPAAAVDSVASLFTGKRTLALTGKGTGGGTAEGFSKGWKYFRTGFDERDLGSKLDYSKVNFGTGKVARAIQAYEETIFKILGAEDQPFYYGAKARSLYSQAIAEAKNKGLRGAERTAFVEEAVQNPTDDMLRYATYDAETAVFQNKTALGTAAKALQKIPGGEIVVPFSKTPSSVAMQVVNYSPLGIIKTLAENIGKGRFDQRLFSQGLGRNAVGTGVMYLGYKMFEKGMVSLGRPTTEREQKQWEVEGRSPNSILIDGKWRGANTLGPAGFTLVLGGYLAQGVEQTGSLTQGLIQMATAVPKTLTDQTFLRGLDEFIGAVTDPARNGKNYFSGLIGSIVPTIVSDVAGATDTTARRTPGILDRLKSRIPGVRETLEPQIDTFGQENTNDKNFLEMMADPTRPSTATNDPVITELRRLSDAGFQATPTQVGDKEGFPDVLTPEQNTELWQRSGQLLKAKLDKLVQSPQYAKMDDEQKQKVIDQFSDKSKVIARAEMVVTLTLGMTGQALKSKLSELKAGGLLTKEVLNKYIEIR